MVVVWHGSGGYTMARELEKKEFQDNGVYVMREETDLDVEDGAGTSGAQKGLQRLKVVRGRREGPPAVLDGNIVVDL